MRRLILKMSMSVDGFVGGPRGELDWLFRSMDDEAAAWTVGIIREAGLHIMGSRTFRDMAAYWPSSSEPFAPPMNEIPKVVFTSHDRPRAGDTEGTTRGLADARAQAPQARGGPPATESWATARVAAGDLSEEIVRLKEEPGKAILAHGGASFARSLVASGLVDEYQLLVHPVVLGRGLPLFSHLIQPLDLVLVETRPFARGAVAHVYRPRG